MCFKKLRFRGTNLKSGKLAIKVSCKFLIRIPKVLLHQTFTEWFSNVAKFRKLQPDAEYAKNFAYT